MEQIKKEAVIVGAIATGSFLAGGGLSYILTKRHFKAKYEKLAEEEIANAKEFYGKFTKKGPYSDPSSTLNEYVGRVSDLRYDAVATEGPVESEEELIEVVEEIATPKEEVIDVAEEKLEEKHNIFVDNQPVSDDFDYEEELKSRTEDRPYVVSMEEFMENENEHEQTTITYFAGDDILADERDEIVEDSDGTVGDLNLTKFGHGSKDPNVVYVRNDSLDLDFEVLLSKGKYAEEVMGFIEHSEPRRKIRKFRSDDE